MRAPHSSAATVWTPHWPAPVNVRALCTTRVGGVSAGPYDSFNLGDHVGDAPEAVAANRARLRQRIGARPVFLRQVHGSAVAVLDAHTPDNTGADGCTTTASGVACTIMVADCLPVLITDMAGRRVAAAHAGWRGLAGGVLAQTYRQFEAEAPVDAKREAIHTIAWLGPCIGPRAFEVGADVKAAFEAQSADAAGCFVPAPAEGKWLADLPALARRQLLALGVRAVYGNDGSDAWCTVNNSSQFFSYRRDAVTGRFAALVWKA